MDHTRSSNSAKDSVRLCAVPEEVAVQERFVFVLIGADARNQSQAVQQCELQLEVQQMALASRRPSVVSEKRESFRSDDDDDCSPASYRSSLRTVATASSDAEVGHAADHIPFPASKEKFRIAEEKIWTPMKSNPVIISKQSLFSNSSDGSNDFVPTKSGRMGHMKTDASEVGVDGGQDFGIYCFAEDDSQAVNRIRLITVQDFKDSIPRGLIKNSVGMSTTCFVFLVDSRLDIPSVALPTIERGFAEMKFLYSQSTKGHPKRMPYLRYVLLTQATKANGSVPSDKDMSDLEELKPFMERCASLENAPFKNWHLTVDFSDVVCVYECFQSISHELARLYIKKENSFSQAFSWGSSHMKQGGGRGCGCTVQ